MKSFSGTNNLFSQLLCVALLAMVLSAKTLLAKEYTSKSYQLECQSATPTTDIVDIFKDYIQHANDVGVLRRVQNDWMAIDSANVASYLQKLHSENPQSAKFTYLFGRMAATNLEKIKIGRTVVALDPKFPYGYRLVCAGYEKLFAGLEKPADEFLLNSELVKDSALFSTWVALDTSDAAPCTFLFYYLLHQKNHNAARMLFESSESDTTLQWANQNRECDLLVSEGRAAEALNKLSTYYNSLPKQPDSDPDGDITDTYVSSLRRNRDYGKVVDYLKTTKHAGWASTLYDMACYSALDKKADDAFLHLNKAVEAGYTGFSEVKTDQDLESLRTDPRWTEFLAKLDASKANSIAKARDALSKTILDKEAPDWTLVGVNGDSVRLSSLRGQVIVLDFWATWCGPCRMAMPVLDRYMKTAMPKKDVRVFSINVWESPAQKAKLFIKNKGYAMTLLFGSNDLSKAYGFGGIPYLCIIDKNGRIRFEENGYSGELENLLPLWVENLLAK